MERKGKRRSRDRARGRAAGRIRESVKRDPSRKAEAPAARLDLSEAEEGRISLGRRNMRLFALAVTVVIAGFVALALGDTTLSPILLVGGYLVLVPWAIMARTGRARAEETPSDGGGLTGGE